MPSKDQSRRVLEGRNAQKKAEASQAVPAAPPAPAINDESVTSAPVTESVKTRRTVTALN